MIKKIVALFLNIFCLLLVFSNSAFALTTQDSTRINNDSEYYWPNQCTTNGVSSSSSSDLLKSGSSVYILGDSITVRAQSQYLSAFQQKSITANIDAQVGRSLTNAGTSSENPGVSNLTSGMQAIAQDKSQISSAGAIVIALGSNGGDTPQTIDSAISAIKADNSTAPIYWVDTIVIDRPSYSPTIQANNQAIYSESATQHYQVISWFKTVDPTGNPQQLSGNETDTNHYIDITDDVHVHPTPAGVVALVNLVVSTVSSGSSSSAQAQGSCACSGGSSSGSTTLVGADNTQKSFNFFVSKGLSDVQAAGVLGNLLQESGLNPEEIQGGGQSQDPAAAGSGGWGIAQWTPGSKVVGIAQSLNVTGLIYELATQLNIVWGEMNTTSPTGVTDMVKVLEQKTDVASATNYFVTAFEGPAIIGPRVQLAQGVLAMYGGSGSSSNSSSSGSSQCSTNGASANCGNATGDAQILCDAKLYDTVSYSETLNGGHQGGAAWHQSCPVIGPTCYLDCSGLVNIAVYDVFKVDLRENTYSEASDTRDWQHIPFSQVQPGDLIQPALYSGGHVEIVDHVVGNTIYTFGAHSAFPIQSEDVGPAQFTASQGDLYLHYVGQNLAL